MARNVGVTDAEITSVATDGLVTGLNATANLTANLICRATDEITEEAVSDTTLQHMLDVFGGLPA